MNQSDLSALSLITVVSRFLRACKPSHCTAPRDTDTGLVRLTSAWTRREFSRFAFYAARCDISVRGTFSSSEGSLDARSGCYVKRCEPALTPCAPNTASRAEHPLTAQIFPSHVMEGTGFCKGNIKDTKDEKSDRNVLKFKTVKADFVSLLWLNSSVVCLILTVQAHISYFERSCTRFFPPPLLEKSCFVLHFIIKSFNRS